MNTRGILKQLFEAYPNNGATEGTVAVYYRLLSDLPVDDLQTIVDQCIIESKFLPTVAEIRERYRSLTAPDLESTAIDQWTKVQKAARLTHLDYVTINWSNPITVKAIEAMGGLAQIGKSDKPGIERAQFLNIWKSLAEAAVGESKLTPAARQLAEREGGLRPIGTARQLPGGDGNGKQN